MSGVVVWLHQELGRGGGSASGLSQTRHIRAVEFSAHKGISVHVTETEGISVHGETSWKNVKKMTKQAKKVKKIREIAKNVKRSS